MLVKGFEVYSLLMLVAIQCQTYIGFSLEYDVYCSYRSLNSSV